MTTKIFVGSLPSGCKPEELRHLFESYGVVTECDVMNRCGFVHMESADMAETAIKALNSTEFKGETINVEPGRIRGERSQKAVNPGGKAGAAGPTRSRNRGRLTRAGGAGPQGIEFDGIDENVTKDALQICSAVFEEMNKMLNPNGNQGGPPRRGGGGGGMSLPKNFASQLEMLSGGVGGAAGFANRHAKRLRQRNNSAGRAPVTNPANANRGAGNAPVVPTQGKPGRAHSQGNEGQVRNQVNAGRPQNQGNAARPQNQNNVRAQNPVNVVPQNQPKPRIVSNQVNVGGHVGNRGNAGRAPNQVNAGRASNQVRAPKQNNVGPIRNEPIRSRNVAPYNRGGNNAVPHSNNINFADDIPIAQNARTFANNLASGNQNDRWSSNNGNFGRSGGGNPLMGRNFDEDIPVTNFNDDLPINNGVVLGNSNNRGGVGMRNQGNLSNHGNFGNNLGNSGGNDRYQSGGGNNDRFQSGGGNNDRFQSGGNYGMGNQDRRGFALPERQNFSDDLKFGNVNQEYRSGNSQLGGGQNNHGNIGGGNRDFGYGNNSGRQQNQDIRNLGGSGGVGGGLGGNDNSMFTRRNYNPGNNDTNNLGNNNRMRNNDMNDHNFGGNFGGNNNNRGGGNPNSNSGFNRNNNNGGGSSNIGGGLNRNLGSGNNNRNNIGGGNNRNNVGGGQVNPLNFQKDFPALSSGQNMNNRNGPRQDNMMSNRRW